MKIESPHIMAGIIGLIFLMGVFSGFQLQKEMSLSCRCGYKPVAIYRNATILECERVIEGCCEGESQCMGNRKYNVSRII